MSNFLKVLFGTFGIMSFSPVIASGTTTSAPDIKEGVRITFQVIQDQLAIDIPSVESATIVTPESASDSYGLQIKLKKSAADELTRISNQNIGKRMNIVFGDVVVSSPTIQSSLGAEFLVSGLTKEQAQNFVKQFSLSKS
jgi:preprotein translocase subunit SecD